MLSIVQATKKKEQTKEPLLTTDDEDIVQSLSNEHRSDSDDNDAKLIESSPTKRHQDNIQDLQIQNESQVPKKFKFRRVVDEMMINICTCCHWQKIKHFRKRHPVCSYLLLYSILTFILAVIGGYIFNKCEYQYENEEINKKILLYNKIKNELDPAMYNDFTELLSMCGVPLDIDQNRWNFQPSMFFAFTTASTIGYGYMTPQTFWGRFATFLYGLPAICVFGLAMIQIGSAIAYTVDRQLKQRQNTHKIYKTNLYKRFFSWISVELRRTFYMFTLLLITIIISGVIFAKKQDEWGYTEGLYFMWISISTIGYGGLHPNIIDNTLWANIIIWIGLALTALVIGSSQDYFQKKVKKWRQEKMNDYEEERKVRRHNDGNKKMVDENYTMLDSTEVRENSVELT